MSQLRVSECFLVLSEAPRLWLQLQAPGEKTQTLGTGRARGFACDRLHPKNIGPANGKPQTAGCPKQPRQG